MLIEVFRPDLPHTNTLPPKDHGAKVKFWAYFSQALPDFRDFLNSLTLSLKLLFRIIVPTAPQN